MEKKCIAYLDVLGFTDYTTGNNIQGQEESDRNAEFAANVLRGANLILNKKIVESRIHPVDGYDENLKYLAKRGALDSFEKLLALSDGMFITSSEDSANDFIEQLSSYLSSCYLFSANSYLYPENPDSPEDVTYDIIHIAPDQSGYTSTLDTRKDYPILFRGGISFDEVEYNHSFWISDGATKKQENIVGKGVVQAVGLERSGKGPKLYIDDTFYRCLNDKNRALTASENDGTKYFLWPAYSFIAENSLEVEFDNDILIFLQSATNLYKAYKTSKPPSVSAQYFEFVKMSILSFLKINLYTHRDAEERIYKYYSSFIRKNNLDIFLINS